MQSYLFLGTNNAGIDHWGMGDKETKKEKNKHSFGHKRSREEKDATFSEKEMEKSEDGNTQWTAHLFHSALSSFSCN